MKPSSPPGDPAIRRVLFAARSCYLDDSNGAAIASRTLMRAMARRGLAVEALCGTMLDLRATPDPSRWLEGRGDAFAEHGGTAWIVDVGGPRVETPRHFRLVTGGVPVTIHRGCDTRRRDPGPEERREFFDLLDGVLARFRPDVVISYGGLGREILRHARRCGSATAFHLHSLAYTDARDFDGADAVLAPSRFAAEHYRAALGLSCIVIPNLVDLERVCVRRREPRYVTLVNPTSEKGGHAFARIAHHLGATRPDIPFLAVESRGTEHDLARCGLDLRTHGNVRLMGHTTDPKAFWRVTRICLVPSLVPETQGLVAVEAMVNGIPVVASDRGAMPETLGKAGLALPLPDRLIPPTRELPTPDEVAPWVETIVRLWDDAGFSAEQSRLALAEARRWSPDVLEPRSEAFFREVRPGSSPFLATGEPGA